MEAPSSTNSRFALPRRVATDPPPFQPPRRSLSVSSAASRTSLLGASRPSDESIETLYNHPSVKIIAFTSSQRTASGGCDFLAEPQPGSLTASSHLERTIAVGPFRIYRAPGSVAFLSCGSALQPILPKSQCWCIDEANSRFVLQIRRPQYWRIEVPLSDAEDVHRALVLREVFDGILLFEKTECPFQRGFTVALPERPQTPVKKKPWTPVGKNLISSPFFSDLSPPSPAAASVGGEKRRKPMANGPETLMEAGNQERKREAPPTPTFPVAKKSSDSPPGAGQLGTFMEVVKTKKATTANVVYVEGNTPEDHDIPQQAAQPAQQVAPYVSEVQEGPRLRTKEGVGADRDVDDCVHGSQDAVTPVEDVETTTVITAPTVMAKETKLGDLTHESLIMYQAREVVPDTLGITIPLVDSEKARPRLEKESTPKIQPYLGLSETSDAHILVDEQNYNATSLTPMEVSAAVPPALARAGELALLPSKLPGPTSEQKVEHCIPDRGISENNISLGVGQVRLGTRVEDLLPSLEDGENVAKTDTSDPIRVDEPDSFEGAGSVGVISLKKKRMSRLLAGRSVTLPTQLTLMTSPISTSTPRLTPDHQRAAALSPPMMEPSEPVLEEASPIESVDSFHSVQSWHSLGTPLPSSPSSSVSPALFPYPHENVSLPIKTPRTVPNAEVTPITEETLVPSSIGATVHAFDTESSTDPTSPTKEEPLITDDLHPVSEAAGSIPLQGRPGLQHRSRTTNLSISRRALSPLPPAANLFSPTVRQRPANRLAAVRNLPGAIINKTVEILLSPPGHLVNLMLKVAAKIAAGEWRGLVFGMGEGGESIPVHWDYSDGELSSWEDDDDYKFSIGRLAKSRTDSSNAPEEQPDSQHDDPQCLASENDRSWEVD